MAKLSAGDTKLYSVKKDTKYSVPDVKDLIKDDELIVKPGDEYRIISSKKKS